jgi:hypothetical protein
MPDQLRARGAPPSMKTPSCPLMPLAAIDTGHVALRREHVRDVAVAAMARHRTPSRRARPIAGQCTRRPTAIARAVPAVQEQDQRPRTCRGDRCRHLGDDLDRCRVTSTASAGSSYCKRCVRYGPCTVITAATAGIPGSAPVAQRCAAAVARHRSAGRWPTPKARPEKLAPRIGSRSDTPRCTG